MYSIPNTYLLISCGVCQATAKHCLKVQFNKNDAMKKKQNKDISELKF